MASNWPSESFPPCWPSHKVFVGVKIIFFSVSWKSIPLFDCLFSCLLIVHVAAEPVCYLHTVHHLCITRVTVTLYRLIPCIMLLTFCYLCNLQLPKSHCSTASPTSSPDLKVKVTWEDEGRKWQKRVVTERSSPRGEWEVFLSLLLSGRVIYRTKNCSALWVYIYDIHKPWNYSLAS